MAACQRKNLGQTTASLAASVIRNAAVVALLSLFYCTGRENAPSRPFRKRPKAAGAGKDNTPVSGHAVWPSSAMQTVTAETDGASRIRLSRHAVKRATRPRYVLQCSTYKQCTIISPLEVTNYWNRVALQGSSSTTAKNGGIPQTGRQQTVLHGCQVQFP